MSGVLRRSRWLCVMLALGIAGGCAIQPPLPRSLIPEPKLSPASFAGTASLAQRLRFEHAAGVPGDTPRTLDVMLEIDPHEVRLAGIAMGQRVLSLRWDGTSLDVQRHPLLPAQVDPARVLRDVQYAYWPSAAISAGLPAGWILEDDAAQRRLLHDGRAVLRIDYAGSPRWVGDVQLDNLLEGYRLKIQSTTQDVEAP